MRETTTVDHEWLTVSTKTILESKWTLKDMHGQFVSFEDQAKSILALFRSKREG